MKNTPAIPSRAAGKGSAICTARATACLEALDQALAGGYPAIFNTDQGAQFTSEAFTTRLEKAHIAIRMDGRGRALDNIFIERLWRSLKYEDS